MHTVPLSRSVIGDCAWIANDAYAPDPFIKWLRPFPSTYPHSRRFYAQRLRNFLHSSHYHVRVAVTDDNDRKTNPSKSTNTNDNEDQSIPDGTPMGWAAWSRRPGNREREDGRQAAMRKDHWSEHDSLFDRFERWAISTMWKYEKIFRVDPGMSEESRSQLISSMIAVQGWFADTFDKHTPTGAYMYLDDIVVDPKFQGRGVGRRLVQQGIDIAEAENIPIGLVASAAGAPVYKKMGFKVVGEDQLRDTESHDVMVYWPKGMEPTGLKKFKVDRDGLRDLE